MTTNNTDTEYSGDITLTGDAETPVKLTGKQTLENIYLMPESVNGDLTIKNAEYIFTNEETTGNTTIESTNTNIHGSLDDGYIEPDGVDGDLLITNPEDVFIAHNAVTGEINTIGEEQRFTDTSDVEPPSNSVYDNVISGWQQKRTITNPTTGVGVYGCSCDITINNVTNDIHVYVLGWDNTVRINAKQATVTLHVTGSHNTIEVSPYTDLHIATDSGIENNVSQDTYPVSELIKTDKNEAYNNAFFGRRKITYQQPASNEDICPNCGAQADAVIERHQEDAFFILSYPIYHFETTSASYECEECSMNAAPKVELTEDERKNLLE